MTQTVPYRFDTQFAPAECCERLSHELENQPVVKMAENWFHRPQIVLGRVSISDIMLYRGNSMVDPGTPIFFGAIVSQDGGSAVVGKFRKHRAQIFFNLLFHVFLSLGMLGMPAFVALGVYRDPATEFSPLLTTSLSIPILVFVGMEAMIWKRSKVTQEDIQLVCNLLDRALRSKEPNK